GEAVGRDREGADAAVVAAAIVRLVSGNAGVTGGVELHLDRLRLGGGRHLVLHRHDRRSGGDVVIQVGDGEGDGVGSDVGAGEAVGRHGQGGDAAVVAAAIVDL